MDGTLSASDAIALRDGDGMFGGGNAFFWVFALLLLGNGGFGYGGGNRDYVTSAELSAQLGNQQLQNSTQQILLSSANNNYETAQLINGQTNTLMRISTELPVHWTHSTINCRQILLICGFCLSHRNSLRM